MLKTLIIFLSLSTSVIAHADAKDFISEATKSAISFSKDIIKGLNDGVDEGRKDAEGVDGAITVTHVDELEKYITVEVLEVKDQGSKTAITVGFKNRDPRPVRIANMDDRRVVLLIDTDGYSQELSERSRHHSEFTVPGSTGKKHTFIFNIGAEKADKIRLWNKEYDLKNHITKEIKDKSINA